MPYIRDTLFSHLSVDMGIGWYREFKLYRRLSSETNVGMVDLDDVAN